MNVDSTEIAIAEAKWDGLPIPDKSCKADVEALVSFYNDEKLIFGDSNFGVTTHALLLAGAEYRLWYV